MENPVIPKDELIKKYYHILESYVPIYDELYELNGDNFKTKINDTAAAIQQLIIRVSGWQTYFVVDKNTRELLYAFRSYRKDQYLFIDSFIKLHHGYDLSLNMFSIIATVVSMYNGITHIGWDRCVDEKLYEYIEKIGPIDLSRAPRVYQYNIRTVLESISKINSKKYEIIIDSGVASPHAAMKTETK